MSNLFQIKEGLKSEYAEYVDKNDKDPYSRRIITFTERWAALMEARVSQGESVKDVADECERSANAEGITGFMYGCAVQALAHFWVHGEELRQWHNIKTQVTDEGERANESGGVLDPAIMSPAE